MKMSVKKIVAIALVLFTILCMFLQWTFLNPKKLPYSAMSYYGTGEAAVQEIRYYLYDMAEDIYSEVMPYPDYNELQKWVRAMDKQIEGTSVIGICNANARFAKVAKQIKAWPSYNEMKMMLAAGGGYYGYMDYEETRLVQLMIDAVEGAGTRSAILLIAFIVAVLLLLHTLISFVLDKKYFGWGAFAGIVALFVIVCIQMLGDKEPAMILMSAYEYEDLLGMYSITAWPILAMVAMLGAAGMWLLYNRERQYIHAGGSQQPVLAVSVGEIGDKFKSLVGGISAGGGNAPWNCPNCGSQMEGKNAFCLQCGTKKPDPKRCPYCQNLLDDNSMFCGKCGKQYVEPKKCVNCGTVLLPDAPFCGNCGTKAD